MTEETSTILSLGDTLTETSVLPEGVRSGYHSLPRPGRLAPHP